MRQHYLEPLDYTTHVSSERVWPRVAATSTTNGLGENVAQETLVVEDAVGRLALDSLGG